MIRCKRDKNHPSSPTSSLHPDPLTTDLSAPGKWRNSPDKITVSWQRSRYVLFVDRSERMRRAKRRNLNRAPTLVSHANPKLPISLAILSSRRGPRGGTGVYGINNCQFRRARDRRETVTPLAGHFLSFTLPRGVEDRVGRRSKPPVCVNTASSFSPASH